MDPQTPQNQPFTSPPPQEPVAPPPITQPPQVPPTPSQPLAPTGMVSPPNFAATPPPPRSQSPFFNKITFMIIGLVALCVLCLVALAALGGNKKDATNNTVSNTYGTDDSGLESNTKTPKAAMTKTPLTQSITTDFGYTVQLNELVRNYAPKYPDSTKETILVKVTISDVNSKYTGTSPYSTDFALVASGKEYTLSYTASSKELNDAGYTTLPTESATKSKPTSGYVAFDVPAGTDKLTFRYKQKETKVINGGSNQVVPAKNYDVALN